MVFALPGQGRGLSLEANRAETHIFRSGVPRQSASEIDLEAVKKKEIGFRRAQFERW